MALAIPDATYVLPIRRTDASVDPELAAYLAALVRLVAVIVVDGSPPAVFARHAAAWPAAVLHVTVDRDRAADLNGKVGGVVTGLRRVRTPKAIVADDDVRYDAFALRRISAELDRADVVRPQNVFVPMPWHAVLDSGRILIARATGGDWPGTLGLRMELYTRAGSYDGDVLFENLELVRTLRALGGRERLASGLFVARRPPSARHYCAQRVRQAYDEFARPARLAVQLALAPLLIASTLRWGSLAPATAAVTAIALAETGRRRDGAVRAFAMRCSLCAPLWVLERAVTSWCALALRVFSRGVRYSHGRLRIAAHSERALRARYGGSAA